MWPLNLLRTRHWILLGVSSLFLLTYSGFVSWGKVAQALEYLADQPAVRERFGFAQGLCPVSEDASARTMAIPFHARLEREDQERVVDALRTCLQ